MQKGSECQPSWQVVNLWEQKQSQNHQGASVWGWKHNSHKIHTSIYFSMQRQWKASCWRRDAHAWVQLADSSKTRAFPSQTITENPFHILMFFTAVAVMCLHHLPGHMTRLGPDAEQSRVYPAEKVLRNHSCWKKTALSKRFAVFRWCKLARTIKPNQSGQYNPGWRLVDCIYLMCTNKHFSLNSRKVNIW